MVWQMVSMGRHEHRGSGFEVVKFFGGALVEAARSVRKAL